MNPLNGKGETHVVLFFSPVLSASAGASLFIFAVRVWSRWVSQEFYRLGRQESGQTGPRIAGSFAGGSGRAQLMPEFWSGCVWSLFMKDTMIGIAAASHDNTGKWEAIGRLWR